MLYYLMRHPLTQEPLLMSASANEFKAEAGDVAIHEHDLITLIEKLKTINDKYKTKSFWQSKSHGDTLATILTEAEAGLKTIQSREMTIADQSAEKKFELLGPYIRKTYLHILDELEIKFNKSRAEWEKDNTKILKAEMSEATRYDMYNCMHLNGEKGHSSTRNIGLILQSMYVKLGDREKIECMKNLASTADSIASTPAPHIAAPELHSVNKHDLNVLVGNIQKFAAAYQADGGSTHSQDVASVLAVAEQKLYEVGIAEMPMASESEAYKTKKLQPKIEAAYIEIAQKLQSQFNDGFNAWAAKNKSIIRSDMSSATRYSLYNCLHLNAEPKKHSSSRNIGVLLQDIYSKLGDKEKMDCMQTLQANPQKSRSPSPSSGNSQ
jgi:hypothetical protein